MTALERKKLFRFRKCGTRRYFNLLTDSEIANMLTANDLPTYNFSNNTTKGEFSI